MTKTAIIFTPKFYNHKTGPFHPETPNRLKVIIDELRVHNLLSKPKKIKLVRPQAATTSDLELVHTKQHIHLVKKTCRHGGGLLDIGDTVVSTDSFETAKFAAGGALQAINSILNGDCENAFALVRPPGHHAGPYYAMGFCIFNNIAIGAEYLRRRMGFKRILILDIDAHHGNGTQEIFYDTSKVLYISLHEDPTSFPGTGFSEEIGKQEGSGYSINIPLPLQSGDKSYLQAFDEIVHPIVKQYEPQFILISAGYDCFYKDPVGKLNLSIHGYSLIFDRIIELAKIFCDEKFVAVLEGGYNLKKLGKLVVMSLFKMTGHVYDVKEKKPKRNQRAELLTRKIINEVKSVQSTFWDLNS